ncbi:HAD-IA family hydrolase [Desulforamulus aquiferis]|uniref:HAD-IA family hydrolase n=1 Tax=Desulforamulus aquiferis TaxID=1397668 RepID=A0AAW7Z8T6_9FIRM|nr:HAD-IA family hydrolase [Desulforamulus aquiferis]MDO7785975.1 HAD-IA family hydrolase [Desulforamulus aquiferis]
MIKYIIFDFDGTLVDSKEVFISVYNQLANKYKFKLLKTEDIEPLRRLSIPERCKYLNFPLYRLPFFALEIYKLYEASDKELIMIEGINNLLSKLAASGYKIAIISSNAEKNIRAFLDKKQITEVSDILCSNNIFGKDKIINKFLSAKGLKPSEAIYVGDELRDIVASKKAKVKIIWVDWGYDIIEMANKEGPDYMANSPEDILKIVRSLA